MVPFLIFGTLAVIISAGVECAPSSISPCDPSPCGPNSACGIYHDGSPVCSCLRGYSGSPPNCRKFQNHDDRDTNAKESCDTKKCGPNFICYIGQYGHPACMCKPGYIVTSIELQLCDQCGTKFDCASNQTCSNFECVDPCPGVCGPNDDCYVFNHKASCRPKGSHPECTSHTDCRSHEACDGYKCVDPCLDLCDHETADCNVTNHEPTCTCKTGFYGSPKKFCRRNGTVE